jgi:CoA:oxalate CoA-transferase
MLDGQIALLENAFVRYLTTGEAPGPEGRRHPVATPLQIIETKDGYMCLAIGNDRQWQDFCAAVGRSELAADERLGTNARRTEHRDLLEGTLREITMTRTTAEWETFLEAHRIPGGPVNTVDRVVGDPQVQARRMVVEVTHPRLGPLRVVNSPLRFATAEVRVEKACPDLGEHTDEVLGRLLGMTPADIEALRAGGAVR